MIITILGVGNVGSAVAFIVALHPELSENLKLFLLDTDEKKLKGEVADLQQAVEILHSNADVMAVRDIHESDIYVFCMGKNGSDREELYNANKPIAEEYLKRIAEVRHENSIVLMMTNPSHRLSQIALEYVPLAIPIGSLLDNARLRLCKATGTHERPEIQKKYMEAKEGKGYTNFAPATECLIRILQWKQAIMYYQSI